jgi:hypothetical protein
MDCLLAARRPQWNSNFFGAGLRGTAACGMALVVPRSLECLPTGYRERGRRAQRAADDGDR